MNSPITQNLICGVDEAGRGPLVGSVVAAAVVLDPEAPIDGLKDSKKLSASAREKLYVEIVNKAKAFSISQASPKEIDQFNILQATLLAMKRAVEGLQVSLGRLPDLALIDGNRCPELSIQAQAIVKGDAKEPAISAASILAKVTRDRQMLALHRLYPEYGFDQHMGYPTPFHLRMIQEIGICPEHRKTFGPVRAIVQSSLI